MGNSLLLMVWLLLLLLVMLASCRGKVVFDANNNEDSGIFSGATSYGIATYAPSESWTRILSTKVKVDDFDCKCLGEGTFSMNTCGKLTKDQCSDYCSSKFTKGKTERRRDANEGKQEPITCLTPEEAKRQATDEFKKAFERLMKILEE